jgi:hypothetical protein
MRVLSGLLLLLVFGSSALAHGWYDMDCCHWMDCAPVTSTAFVASNVLQPANMVVSTQFGTALVPHNFQVRPSKDGQLHACIREGRLICLYVPPSM